MLASIQHIDAGLVAKITQKPQLTKNLFVNLNPLDHKYHCSPPKELSNSPNRNDAATSSFPLAAANASMHLGLSNPRLIRLRALASISGETDDSAGGATG